jgi:Flp pilus assembly pilin Flp
MIRFNNNESGFGVIEVILIIAIVATLIFAGWYVLHVGNNNNSITPKTTPLTPTSSPPVTSQTPPANTTSKDYACIHEGLCPPTNGIKSGAK